MNRIWTYIVHGANSIKNATHPGKLNDQAMYLVLMLILGLALPLAPMAQERLSDADFEDLLSRWDDTLTRSERVLQQPGIGKREIQPLLENVTVVKESAIIEREQSYKQLAKQKALLDALGLAPPEREPPESTEIANQRASLRAQVARYDGRAKHSKIITTRADNLLRQIAEFEYGLLARVLSKRVPSPLSPRVIATGFAQLPERLTDLAESISSWWSTYDLVEDAGQSRDNWLTRHGLIIDATTSVVILVSIILIALAVVVGVQYWLCRHYGRAPAVQAPTSSQRYVATLVEVSARVVVPTLAIIIIAMAALYGTALDRDFESIANAIVLAAVQLVLIFGISKVVLAPDLPQWRPSRFTDQAAAGLNRALRLFAGVTFFLYSLIAVLGPSVEDPLRVMRVIENTSPPELSSLAGMTTLVIVVALLLNILRPVNWRLLNTNTEPPTKTRPSALFRIVVNAARIALISSLVFAVLGYLNFSLFVAKRTIWTLGLLAAARLTHNSAVGGLREATADDNRLGSWVRNRLGLDDAGGTRIVFWIALLLDVILFIAVLMLIALIWGMSWTEVRPVINNLIYGTEIGGYRFSLAKLGIALCVFALLMLGIRLLKKFLSNRILVQTRLDVGVRDALTSGVGYVGIVLAALFTFSILGLKLSELAIIFGALSVGIGFGLQHVVNNFVSGLVLLIQRPIKAGDWIVVGDKEGYVKQVNVIATEIQTFDNASLIVPNSNLVTSEVLNWMHKSKLGRVILAVGVSYSSDTEQVREILHRCAAENPDVLRRPAPQVIFREFGNSALEFELRYYIRDIDNRLRTASDLRFQIKKAFDKVGIEIPFPQRDIHIRDLTGAETWLSNDSTTEPAADRNPTITRLRGSESDDKTADA